MYKSSTDSVKKYFQPMFPIQINPDTIEDSDIQIENSSFTSVRAKYELGKYVIVVDENDNVVLCGDENLLVGMVICKQLKGNA